ncbi:cell division protein FtsZ [Nanoarchaeota archaeon]|nr:MAG: cell division protein FtsZ [Nanoarchaeota archaeon]
MEYQKNDARVRNSKTKEIDEELERIVSQKGASIKVVGVGGGGNNTISRMYEIGIKGVELIAVNTDAAHLLITQADNKILIGKDLTQGLGAGADPRIGREAAKEQLNDIKKALKGSDMVFVTCGLGGGTGTGAAPIIAEASKSLGILTVAVVTLPFSVEGKARMENAMDGLERLEEVCDTIIVIPNDKLLSLVPDLPLTTAFRVADEILTNAVKGIAELVTTSGLVNLDFADIKAVMSEGGVAMIGVGESDSENRAIEAVNKAINNPLLDVDISQATGALINITGGPDMTLDEANKIVKIVTDKLSEDAKVIFGARLVPDMKKAIRVTLIVTGVTSPQIYGKDKEIEAKKREEIGNELGIEYIK